jgi:hypothetical protein
MSRAAALAILASIPLALGAAPGCGLLDPQLPLAIVSGSWHYFGGQLHVLAEPALPWPRAEEFNALELVASVTPTQIRLQMLGRRRLFHPTFSVTKGAYLEAPASKFQIVDATNGAVLADVDLAAVSGEFITHK